MRTPEPPHQPSTTVEAPPTWETVLASLEFEVQELQHEQAALNFWHPEAILERQQKLERARHARHRGWSVQVWGTIEAMKQAEASEQRMQLERAERCSEMELDE